MTYKCLLLVKFARQQKAGVEKLRAMLPALAGLAAKTNAEVDRTANYARFARLAPHLRALAGRGETADPSTAARLWNALGYHLYAVADYAAARAAFERALWIDEAIYDPKHPKVATDVNNLGAVMGDLGDLAEAQVAFERAIELDPQDAVPHYSMVDIFIKQEKFDEARRELNKRIRLTPENPFTPLVTLGILARHQGLPECDQHFQDALAHWDAAWRLRWQSPAELLKNKAIALLCLGEKEQALQVLQEAIAQMGPGDERSCWP